MLKRIILVLLSLSLIQCKSTQEFEKKITEKSCEEALELVPENQSDYRLISKAQEVSGTVLSYSATGVAFTVQVLWDVTAGVAGTVVLCAPAFALMAATQGQGSYNNLGALCLNGDIGKIMSPPLGKHTYNATENWNCPDVDSVSRSIRNVAQCYLDRGGPENRTKAFANLQAVSKSGSFYRCLSDAERSAFLKDFNAANPISAN